MTDDVFRQWCQLGDENRKQFGTFFQYVHVIQNDKEKKLKKRITELEEQIQKQEQLKQVEQFKQVKQGRSKYRRFMCI